MNKTQAQKQWISERKDIAMIAGIDEIEVENVYQAIKEHYVRQLQQKREIHLPGLVEMKWREGQIKANPKIEFDEKEEG